MTDSVALWCALAAVAALVNAIRAGERLAESFGRWDEAATLAALAVIAQLV